LKRKANGGQIISAGRQWRRRQLQVIHDSGYEDVEVYPLPTRLRDGDERVCARVQIVTGTCKQPEKEISGLVKIVHKDEAIGKVKVTNRRKRKPTDAFDPLIPGSDLVYHRVVADIVLKNDTEDGEVKYKAVDLGVGMVYATLFSNDNFSASIGIHKIELSRKWEGAALRLRMLERIMNKYPTTSIVMSLNNTQVQIWQLLRLAALSANRDISVGHITGINSEWTPIDLKVNSSLSFPRPQGVFLPKNCEYSLTVRMAPEASHTYKRMRRLLTPFRDPPGKFFSIGKIGQHQQRSDQAGTGDLENKSEATSSSRRRRRAKRERLKNRT